MRGIGFEAVETSIDENTRLSLECVCVRTVAPEGPKRGALDGSDSPKKQCVRRARSLER